MANIFSSSNSGASGSAGLIYINDIQPISGNVGDKVYLANSNNKIITSCSSDNTSVRVYIIAMIGSSNLRPAITINGVAVGHWNHTAYSDDNRVLFRGYADVTIDANNKVIATHEDGGTAECLVNSDSKPIISEVIFTGGYPGTQTELKENDHFDIKVTTDLPFIKIEVLDYEACKSGTYSVGDNTVNTVTTVIANRGNTSVLRTVKVRVQKASGTYSDWFESNSSSTNIDGTDVVNLNNLHPSVSIGSITYPVSQEALKDSESADIANTASDYDTITYSSSSDLSVALLNTFENPKTVDRINGNYNVSTNNFFIDVHRIANDSSASASTVVKIADSNPVITVTEQYSRLRSGGNDGTSIPDYTITIHSDQNLIEIPSLNLGTSGTWLGTNFTGSGTTYTRQIQIHDDDTKGTFSYGTLNAKNLANRIVTVVTGDNNYVIGGFVNRTITLPAFANEVNIDVMSIDYSKVAMTWNIKALPNKRPVGTTATPDPDSWCLDALNVKPSLIRILDTSSTDAQSQDSSITIQESV